MARWLVADGCTWAATKAEVSLMLVRLPVPRKLGRKARPEKLGSNPNPYSDQSNYLLRDSTIGSPGAITNRKQVPLEKQ